MHPAMPPPARVCYNSQCQMHPAMPPPARVCYNIAPTAGLRLASARLAPAQLRAHRPLGFLTQAPRACFSNAARYGFPGAY